MGPPPFGDGNLQVVDTFYKQALVASMGPPPFGDGNFPEGTVGDLLYELQWGHRLSAMETMVVLLLLLATLLLQWGHRLSAMETMERGSRKPVPLLWASMGPPPFGDGNMGEQAIPRTLGRLQWGHRLSAMETEARCAMHFSSVSLQWGHRLSAMETCLGTRGRIFRPRFNGATAFRRWKLYEF